MCPRGHISVTKWCFVGYRTNALLDLWIRCIQSHSLCLRNHWRFCRLFKQFRWLHIGDLSLFCVPVVLVLGVCLCWGWGWRYNYVLQYLPTKPLRLNFIHFPELRQFVIFKILTSRNLLKDQVPMKPNYQDIYAAERAPRENNRRNITKLLDERRSYWDDIRRAPDMGTKVVRFMKMQDRLAPTRSVDDDVGRLKRSKTESEIRTHRKSKIDSITSGFSRQHLRDGLASGTQNKELPQIAKSAHQKTQTELKRTKTSLWKSVIVLFLTAGSFIVEYVKKYMLFLKLTYRGRNKMAATDFAGDIFQCIFLNKNLLILIHDSPKLWVHLIMSQH